MKLCKGQLSPPKWMDFQNKSRQHLTPAQLYNANTNKNLMQHISYAKTNRNRIQTQSKYEGKTHFWTAVFLVNASQGLSTKTTREQFCFAVTIATIERIQTNVKSQDFVSTQAYLSELTFRCRSNWGNLPEEILLDALEKLWSLIVNIHINIFENILSDNGFR